MTSRHHLMTECAKDQLKLGDKEAHDAIMEAIDDQYQAVLKYPNKKKIIKNAISYTRRELRNSGYSG